MSAICKDCGADFDISESAKRKCMYLCKPCRAIRSRANYERRKAAGLRVSGRPSSPEHSRAYHVVYDKKPEVRARKAELARQRSRNPLERPKHEARWITRRAIASGKLVREPCEVCGNPKVDAHHDDYCKPLSVRWLCRAHHFEHHYPNALARGESNA